MSYREIAEYAMDGYSSLLPVCVNKCPFLLHTGASAGSSCLPCLPCLSSALTGRQAKGMGVIEYDNGNLSVANVSPPACPKRSQFLHRMVEEAM